MEALAIIDSHLWDMVAVKERGPKTALYVFMCRSCEAQSCAVGDVDGPPPERPTARPGHSCPDALLNVVIEVHDR